MRPKELLRGTMGCVYNNSPGRFNTWGVGWVKSFGHSHVAILAQVIVDVESAPFHFTYSCQAPVCLEWANWGRSSIRGVLVPPCRGGGTPRLRLRPVLRMTTMTTMRMRPCVASCLFQARLRLPNPPSTPDVRVPRGPPTTHHTHAEVSETGNRMQAAPACGAPRKPSRLCLSPTGQVVSRWFRSPRKRRHNRALRITYPGKLCVVCGW